MALLIALVIVILAAPEASAQTREPRVTLSLTAAREYVSIENGDGSVAAAGVAVSLRVMRFLSLEGEATAASGEVLDRDRLATAGPGTALGISLHTALDRRVAGRLSLGLGMRRYEHVHQITGERYTRDRGGPWAAAGVPIALTERLAFEPEVRWMFTIADELFMVRSIGVKAGWRF